MYIADPKDKRPAYLQLYSQIKDDIVSGVFPFQGKLPSKRIMAGDSGLSTITVKHAYQLLCDEGYIESRERSGYFVIFRSGDGFISTENKSLAHLQYLDSEISEFPFSVFTFTDLMLDFHILFVLL